ncbi:aspartate-tRNA cytoplasmic [Micractinium conductrix]|uniref:aspartate--tRNA ligase n=1 Tax=Micractinium conductrix TaxID=554055 RepID=A0A2P6VJM0_9CHLO|nr:aspartate-tRNA cytoplasmic [Micractinium conductrix]|eukprot:PSC74260.1 aspartate-tRNA cytoplasmic [Micractinium conductrix]
MAEQAANGVAKMALEGERPAMTPEQLEAEREARKKAKAAEKAAKEAAKAARAAQRGQKQGATAQPDEDDPLADRYGDTELVQSAVLTGRSWTAVGALTPELAGKPLLIRARVHNVRGKGKSAFLVLRQATSTVQAVLFVDDVNVSKGMVKYASALPRESIVDVEGTLAAPEAPIVGCSQSEVELHVTSIRCVSRASALPFEVTDAARSAEAVKAAAERGEVAVTVGQDVRLDNRFVDLRTPANQAIFRVQSEVCQLFREALQTRGFIEIHTPKLLSGASEGGAAVFRFDYMGRPGCLAQSPQFYKQMAICSDLGRVFEIGPVFRAENSYTHRHLCEFTGMDMEMEINESYDEVLDVLDALFVHMFKGLNERMSHELAVINEQFPYEPLKFLEKTLRLTFAEGIQMLQEAGYDVDPFGDLNTELERALGKIVKEKYNTEFYMLHRYPLAIRPFYTMPCKDDPRYSCSFDIFIRGEEIISGAQRIHDPALLTERAVALGLPVETIQSYIDSFKFGAPPHGGAGVGMERVVMLFCGLDNIRKTSMFPRDPKRLTP